MTDEQRDRSQSKALMQLEDATTEALETGINDQDVRAAVESAIEDYRLDEAEEE
jgi:hypothetical protein